MAGCRSTGRRQASRRRCQTPTRRRPPGTARERPRSPRCGRRPASGSLASGSPTMNLMTLPTRRPSRSAVGKSIIASPGARRLIIRPEITLNRFSRKPARPLRSVTAISSGAGATPAGRQNGRRCRHIDAGPLRDLGHRLHLRQRPPRIDVPRGAAGDQVVTVLRLHEPRIGRLGTPCTRRGRHGRRPRQADQQSQAQPRPPPGPQLRAEPHPDRAHTTPPPANILQPIVSAPLRSREAGQHRHPRWYLHHPGRPPERGRLSLRRARQLAGHPLTGRRRPACKP